MPSKSKAQFGKMGKLFSEGKISKKSLDNFNKGVDPNKLPDKVKKSSGKVKDVAGIVAYRKKKFGS